MPEEVFVLFILMTLSVFILTMLKMILNHRKGRTGKNKVSSDESSMTTSELESMMRRAVEGALSGLSGKVEDLEMEIVKMASKDRMLPAPDTSDRIEFDDEVIDVEPVRASSKTKA